MRFRTLASDFDGTLAFGGRVDPADASALAQLRAAGWSLLLVTGRQVEDVRRAFPRLQLFDRVVAENGAVLARPDGSLRMLSDPPTAVFLRALRRRRVPYGLGHVIVATTRDHEAAVAAAIAGSGGGLAVSFNKSALMVLPAGVDKASGLLAVLAELDLPAADVVGVGDAENDLPFLALCGLAVACAGALPEVRAQTASYTPRVLDLARDLLGG